MSGVQIPPPLLTYMKVLYPQFLKHIQSTQLINRGEHIIIALSGGKDSVTLTLLLKELQHDLPISLSAAYFNHQIRHDAQQEEQWVRKFCQQHQLELTVASQDIMKLKTREKLNLENAASISRYRFLNEVSLSFVNAKVATAHTRSDLSETFFIKLLRGSGLQGLSAIHSQKGSHIIRPLLLFSQEEIFSFLSRNQIPFYKDYSNDHPDFLRNRIRQGLIPQIKKIENNLDSHIYKTVSIIQHDYEFLSSLGVNKLSESLILGKVLPISSLQPLHLALQRIIIREYIRLLKGNLLNIDFDHIHNILSRMRETKGLAIPGLKLKFHKGYIFPETFSIPDYTYSVSKKNCTIRINEINGQLRFRESHSFSKPADNFQISLPLNLVKFPIQIRCSRATDNYVKINSTIRQKVFEMIRASGMPAQLRKLRPLVVNGNGQIIWVVGSQIAHPFKVPLPAPADMLVLRFKAKHAFQALK